MPTLVNANDLTLADVHRLLKIERNHQPTHFSDLLTLEPLTETEKQEVFQIASDFEYYQSAGKVLEGQVQFLVLAPLLRLAGFYRPPIYLSLEQGIAEISIVDEDTNIRGRLDILAAKTVNNTKLWMLVVETKNSEADAMNGLPQLLTYAYSSLEQQESVWGLTTNGISFRFIYMQQGDPTTYRILPEVNLVDRDRALQLLQALNSVRKL